MHAFHRNFLLSNPSKSLVSPLEAHLRTIVVTLTIFRAISHLASNIVWGLYSILVSTLHCTPVQAIFDAHVPGNCLNETRVFVSIVAWGIAWDLAAWALLVPTVWHLHLLVANRIALSLIFALGLA